MTDSTIDLHQVFEGKERLVLYSDGNHLYDVIESIIKDGSAKSITIDFDKISLITTAFLNSSIGKLRSTYPNIALHYKNVSDFVQKKIERTESVIRNKQQKSYNTASRDQLCESRG